MKILLADDHELIRSGLRNELADLDAVVEFVEAWDAESLARMFRQHDDLDLALVDLAMPGMEGPQTVTALCQTYTTVPLIVLSAADTAAVAQAILGAGAAGFIPKSAMARVMLQAIRLVLAGGRYVPPELLGVLHESNSRFEAEPGASPRGPAHGGAVNARLTLLSHRQREVFALLARGLTNKMIARELNVTEGTVKTHVATIFDVLNVHNRVSAVAEARRLSEKDDDSRPAGGR